MSSERCKGCGKQHEILFDETREVDGLTIVFNGYCFDCISRITDRIEEMLADMACTKGGE